MSLIKQTSVAIGGSVGGVEPTTIAINDKAGFQTLKVRLFHGLPFESLNTREGIFAENCAYKSGCARLNSA